MSPQKIVSGTRFQAIVASIGAVIMALEILSSRVLAPFFGNSVYVWGSIISVFLAALSIGYYLGGRLADRQPRLALLGRLMAIAAACMVLLLAFGTRLAGAGGEAPCASPLGTRLAGDNFVVRPPQRPVGHRLAVHHPSGDARPGVSGGYRRQALRPFHSR
jgi:MFS family permease